MLIVGKQVQHRHVLQGHIGICSLDVLEIAHVEDGVGDHKLDIIGNYIDDLIAVEGSRIYVGILSLKDLYAGTNARITVIEEGFVDVYLWIRERIYSSPFGSPAIVELWLLYYQQRLVDEVEEAGLDLIGVVVDEVRLSVVNCWVDHGDAGGSEGCAMGSELSDIILHRAVNHGDIWVSKCEQIESSSIPNEDSVVDKLLYLVILVSKDSRRVVSVVVDKETVADIEIRERVGKDSAFSNCVVVYKSAVIESGVCLSKDYGRTVRRNCVVLEYDILNDEDGVSKALHCSIDPRIRWYLPIRYLVRERSHWSYPQIWSFYCKNRAILISQLMEVTVDKLIIGQISIVDVLHNYAPYLQRTRITGRSEVDMSVSRKDVCEIVHSLGIDKRT